MKISKQLTDINVGTWLTVVMKDEAVKQVHHQLVVGRNEVNNDPILFDLTTSKLVAESKDFSTLVQKYLMNHSGVIHITNDWN